MVLAISMQQLDIQYAGLADSFYLAAAGYMEEIIWRKDIKTLQCLVLVAQYSLLTPTRLPVYYIMGLATKLCQQLGLTGALKTATLENPSDLASHLQLDMRRRLYWIVFSIETTLSHSLGRPDVLADQDHHVPFCEPIDDQYITTDGIMPGPSSEKKAVAIHFFRVRLIQAEIGRVLYQKKRLEPKNEGHPWYTEMEQKLKDWLNACPQDIPHTKSWYVLGIIA
jgi:hypothetical protein